MTDVLAELHITGLGVIDDATLEPHPAFTVVSGETGAGKTMVVTALGLVTGGRGDSSRVRSGSDRSVVEARLMVAPGGSAAVLVESAGGRLDDDASVILVRSVGADGRSRAHIGGRAAPLALLAELTEPMIAVHGQSEAIRLLQPAHQRDVLDRFARNETQIAEYLQARGAWRTAVTELATRTGQAVQRAQREAVLRLGLDEIDKIDPRPDEDVELAAEIRRLDNADTLRAAAQSAVSALAGGSVGSAEAESADAVTLIEGARRTLEGAGDDRLATWAPGLREASTVLVDVVADLSGYLADLDADPVRLEQLQTRQSALRSLTRRFGPNLQDVLDWRADAGRELISLDSSEETINALKKQCALFAAETAAAARQLSAVRSVAAARLGTLATTELAHLAMGRATLRVAVNPRDTSPESPDALFVDGRYVTAGTSGIDLVEFLMTSHPAAPELPVSRGASGGELSRVMLAVEVVLAGADTVQTLVFDEVDAGVGGQAATEIGRRLALLSRNHQVIVVTHLAQVAAFADRHVVIDAAEDGAVRVSALRQVDGDDREIELARMLGGTDGAAGRAHARDLLHKARIPAVARKHR